MEQMNKGNYGKFGIMIATSFVIMYAVMFLNIDRLDHLMLSHTRTYMSLLMVSPMAVAMLLFMWGMYGNKKFNYLILGAAILVFATSLYALRQQVFINDVQWMKAMIPHHSSAILVSQKANLKDPEAIQLASDIIEAQKREIGKMNKIIDRLEAKEK